MTNFPVQPPVWFREITWFREIRETIIREIILFGNLIWDHPPSLQPAYVRVRRNDPFPGPGGGGIGL